MTSLRWGVFATLTIGCGSSPPPAPAHALRSVAAPRVDVSTPDAAVLALRQRFDTLAADRPGLATALDASRRRFPEGDTLPLVLAVSAYAQLARSGAIPAEHARDTVGVLLSELVVRVRRVLGVSDLSTLQTYGEHGTALGELAFALGQWRITFSDTRYDGLHHHLVVLLVEALAAAGGAPIASSPSQLWPIDTVVALDAVALHDRAFGTTRSEGLVAAHRAWAQAHGTDARTGLPVFRADVAGAAPPRGSDLSWRIALLADLDAPYARAVYGRYVGAFWVDDGAMAGFAEWPDGIHVPADVDSGPIFGRVGATASAFGIAAARANDDAPRYERLVGQLGVGRRLVVLQHGGSIGGLRIDARYVTGFLMGDATLFYSLTWRPRS